MSSSEKTKWPCNGRFRETLPRSRKPTIVFIHNYGGNRSSSHRHQDMVLDLGYNCFSFDLSPSFGKASIEQWTRELEQVLDAIPGPKIIFSFSFPSASVPALLARQPRADVKAWICDGGPFCETWRCYWNLLTRWKKGNVLTRAVRASYIWLSAGGPAYDWNVNRWVNALDPRFPILSIREGGDKLVPARAIEKFFSFNPKLHLQKLVIPGADHLEGLKKSPEAYIQTIKNFLDKHA